MGGPQACIDFMEKLSFCCWVRKTNLLGWPAITILNSGNLNWKMKSVGPIINLPVLSEKSSILLQFSITQNPFTKGTEKPKVQDDMKRCTKNTS